MTKQTLASKKIFLQSAVLTALLCCYCCPSFSYATEQRDTQLPFSLGERLTFRIRWSFIPAGEATLEVSPQDDALTGDSQHFVLTAKTTPAIDILYKFRERVDSFTDKTVSQTLLYRKVQSGKSRRNIEVSFDWQKNKVQYSNFGKPMPPIDLQPGTLDPLSSLYFIRQHSFADKKILERPVTDGKKVVIGKVHYIKQETISIRGTSYDTIKLEPELKHVKGVFEKSKNAKMYIWITNDSRRLLVKLKSKVVIGSFIAELIDYREKTGEEKSDGAT